MPLLVPAANQVTVRMYRIGHGDCFLLAMPRDGKKGAYYVLIDCGYKPGSPEFIHGSPAKNKIDAVVDHIFESTGGKIDLFIVTHEHQDHCNGIWKAKNPYFGKFEIARAWFAWTEKPDDDVANELRRRHRDVLLGLVEARNKLQLAAGGDDEVVQRLDALLSLESGGEALGVQGETDPAKSVNKQALKLVKEKALAAGGEEAVSYLFPGECHDLPGSAGVRAFVLGPPRDADLLEDEDPVGSEGFHRFAGVGGLTFAAAARSDGTGVGSPFSPKFRIPRVEALKQDWFKEHYGDAALDDAGDKQEARGNAPWRRIDMEWLYSAENLALKLNTGINNTSLVLAFELPKSKKVLLFVGDAQRGNWISWDDQTWRVDGETHTAKDILARCVLYKVGHHGSHNATLDGTEESDYPNLAWMGKGRHGREFTAMITAVNEWALKRNRPPWVHPLPAIRSALDAKTGGRLFQTDDNGPPKGEGVSKSFLKRVKCEDLFFDYTIMDR